MHRNTGQFRAVISSEKMIFNILGIYLPKNVLDKQKVIGSQNIC